MKYAMDINNISKKDFFNLPSEVKLIADLKKTFPSMHVRPLKEYGVSYMTYGAWIGGDDCVMPDGLPVFDELQVFDSNTHEGGVHVGFAKWLEDRGWYYEKDDAGVYLIVPIVMAVGNYGKN